MSLDISSFTGSLNSPVHTGQSQKPSKEHYQSGSSNPTKDIDAYEGKSGLTETLDQISFSADHTVDYKINQETREVVIRVVDRETGEVVRQIPGEDFLKLTQRIAEFNQEHLNETV
ncbi:MAG: flagellar protein FlaG [Nitrospinae bacterium]|nr:flagellar protein FlaG [Nitrospinota bacterium]MBL7021518.1 flagellar protein FlaG [Nitrospinaceae bacterium]